MIVIKTHEIKHYLPPPHMYGRGHTIVPKDLGTLGSGCFGPEFRQSLASVLHGGVKRITESADMQPAYLLLPIFAYLLGSVPSGLVLTRLFSDVDIRKEGSGNIGATNVRRLAGNRLGMMTLFGDVLKGALPTLLAGAAVDIATLQGQLFVSLVAMAAIIGHFFPVYLKFGDGGKGVATTAGAFLMISPGAVLVTLLVFILGSCWSNRVSVASLVAAAALPVCVWVATGSAIFTGAAVLVAVGIFIRHKDNVDRLLKGTEPTIW